jgi:dynein heavy chain
MATMPGRQFNFNEHHIFGKFDLFCRRVIKLSDMFGTIQQFTSLSENRMEGMESLIADFDKVVASFKAKRHNLLAYHDNQFDRDYVEFNVKISELEAALQTFIDESFDAVGSIETALRLLHKFQSVLHRESFQTDLDTKLNTIFQNFGDELESVKTLYEDHKAAPPISRNLPTVAGSITWSRHLLARIEGPMKRFSKNPGILASRDAKRIIKKYNKLAKTLLSFEYLWYRAWVESIDAAKAGLQATLIIRHPADDRLYVNFDEEILCLIREAKCLDRMGIEIPDSAKIVLVQEEKFKGYRDELQFVLKTYEALSNRIIPVTAQVLRSHINDMEYKLRPGMITLTWTSMNIDAYKNHAQQGLEKLEELIHKINDIMENRIEQNLRAVSKALLVHLPEKESMALDEFVKNQQDFIAEESLLLQQKNMQVENAVEDTINIVCNYPLDSHVAPVSLDAVDSLRKHYNHFMYQALLNCTKSSLNALKKRIARRSKKSMTQDLINPGEAQAVKADEHPFFNVDVQLSTPSVRLSPPLSDIQEAINVAAQAVLQSTKSLVDWGQQGESKENRVTFFHKIAQDIEIVRVCLLLTGSVQGAKNQVHAYLDTFKKYDWLWKTKKADAYQKFIENFGEEGPGIDGYEAKLKEFVACEDEIDTIPVLYTIGALSLDTQNLKQQLKLECNEWKVTYSERLHKKAREKMDALSEYMKTTTTNLTREVGPGNLDALRAVMDTLKEIRARESSIDVEDIGPVIQMYDMLQYYLSEKFIKKEELDEKSVLRANWSKLSDVAEEVTDALTETSEDFRKDLLKNVREFTGQVEDFRKSWLEGGPMVPGITAQEGSERIRRYQEDFDIYWRKYELYAGGEELFALRRTKYESLVQTQKELALLTKLFSLYNDVLEAIELWSELPWAELLSNIEAMTEKMENFEARCKKLPKKLRDFQAYAKLEEEVTGFSEVLPLFRELCKESIKPRHWDEVMQITGSTFEVGAEDFKLKNLLDANLVAHVDDILDVTDGADKQLTIEKKLAEIREIWEVEEFMFGEFNGRTTPILKSVPPRLEELDESQIQCQTMLTLKNVTPFRADVQAKLNELTETTDVLELWQKVQLLWCNLESVFTGGDIAKQMPLEAKKFSKIDKEFLKLMTKAQDTGNIVAACASEALRTALPEMFTELEKCSKSLEGYLEGKRNKFPRFYFVSSKVLLMILSQGSDPLAMQPYYQAVFDSIVQVVHDKSDKTIIREFMGRFKGTEEIIPFSKPVEAKGNIEDWLLVMLKTQCLSLKDLCRNMAVLAADMGIGDLRSFVDGQNPQYALLGLQVGWTNDFHQALLHSRTKKHAVQDAQKKTQGILNEISSWCLQDLGTKFNRRKIETLITIQVHQRDVGKITTDLFKARKLVANAVTDFQWLQQCRFYWQTEDADQVDDDGRMMVSITDVDFSYQYEYLGCKDRLVITPLTDRCLITLAQALGMYFGGAPAGPAGTGKTETVKDMAGTLGIYIMVTNCSDQMNHKQCASIFKGLCQSGLWGCFDEFNRIKLPVLSVVAQQVQAALAAKKANVKFFNFPGDPQNVSLDPVCGFFITMNPGYAGRQELPENLKAQFRGVTMMVPNKETIIATKLCSFGFSQFNMLATKFRVLYELSEDQLSFQNHYDFGLRNILSVLRTAGETKRANLDKSEESLLYQTLRDMNLSKFVAQDVPLFISLLEDLFPTTETPEVAAHPAVETAIAEVLKKTNVDGVQLVRHMSWVQKIIQLYETTLVRHGIMVCGPAGGGKTQITHTLMGALSITTGTPHVEKRINPKAIRAAELYGEVDKLSGEWNTGVFAAIWARYNNRASKNITWIVEDGPVDAIWIEDLNTVLDDNQILTLANGDRIPMTDNTKIMFENECLDNASPATVSRTGIIYVSDTDLDWAPIAAGWVLGRPEKEQETLTALFLKWVGENNAVDVGHCFDFISRYCDEAMGTARMAKIMSLFRLLTGMLQHVQGEATAEVIERYFVFALVWSMGGLLETDDRVKFDEYLRTIDDTMLPPLEEHHTVYEYAVDEETCEWAKWRPPLWTYPDVEEGERLDFSNLLVPTMDTTRSLYIIETTMKQNLDVLMIGGPGTAKTSTALMYYSTLDPAHIGQKMINFSSATSCAMFQANIEDGLDKRGGKSFGPPNNKQWCVFMDDVSMPLVNEWGDQPTLEIVRQIVETDRIAFLDKDKRGEIKICEDLKYMAAMGHPGGGKNDIPNRLKRHFVCFNLVLPAIQSINDLYGQMLGGRFSPDNFPSQDAGVLAVVDQLTAATIDLWNKTKVANVPTPAKFHYIFNIRELSRVFQGVLLSEDSTIMGTQETRPESWGKDRKAASNVVCLWAHECARVFCDKLVLNKEKDWFANAVIDIAHQYFGDAVPEAPGGDFVRTTHMVDFLRNDVYDEDEVLVEEAPKIYEFGGDLLTVRERVDNFLNDYNSTYPSKQMELVLFDEALKHMTCISRILGMPRGSALLVGVGGSGKQSLTRLSSHIARNFLFQITLTKAYKTPDLLEDLRTIYREAGQKQRNVTFLFTDAEIKDESFLEYINSLLMTGNIPGLFAKDEMMGLTADLVDKFEKERPGQLASQENLSQFFIDIVRDNLHVVLCMSPVNAKFAERARFFPGLINCCTIDWFLPWSQEALVTVSKGFILQEAETTFVEVEEVHLNSLTQHIGNVHAMVQEACEEYFAKMRRHIYLTPKSYLSFIQSFKTMYKIKLEEVKTKERNVNLGLEKLIKGASDVEDMKEVLKGQEVHLKVAISESEKMMGNLEVASLEAQKENDVVEKIKSKCEEDAAYISKETEACQADLAIAMPFVTMATAAIDSIDKKDVSTVKNMGVPPLIIQIVFENLMLLFHEGGQALAGPFKMEEMTVNRKSGPINFIAPAWEAGKSLLNSDPPLLQKLQDFGAVGKDLLNEETVEFLEMYVDRLGEDYTPVIAKGATSAGEGLCTFTLAMAKYYRASKVVKPKLESLAILTAQYDTAMKRLAAAQTRLDTVQALKKDLQDSFDKQMAEKRRIENTTIALAKKKDQASQLIDGLAGERVRWGEDSKNAAITKQRLVGDCAVACAFACYTGGFNQTYRQILIGSKFTTDCKKMGVPVTEGVDVVDFQVDIGTRGDWTQEGLPTDILSVQNGILVTKSDRYPLMIDPQGQALSWLSRREKDRIPVQVGICQITNNRLKDHLEYCMAEGMTLLVAGVEEEIDPMLDPVMNKEITKRGRSKFIVVADKQCDYSDDFMLYFITRLPNPHFSPELQAKTTVVDFTVTMKGLEDQLLGRVIGKEQKALEDQLNQVLAEVNENTKALLLLDSQLLERLTSNTGNLLDDPELIGVLAETKSKAAEVSLKLVAADETRQSINRSRERYRPVATRGSVMYFAVVDMTLVNVMYQTSLAQFMGLFMASMDNAEKSSDTDKRVHHIIDTMTYEVYRYINRGLYESHKIVFVFLFTVKILVIAGMLRAEEFALFLRGGAALDILTVKSKPFAWLSDESWLNVIQLSNDVPLFKNLTEDMTRNEQMWRRWYEHNLPETEPIPDYESRIVENLETGAWARLLVIRMLRMDRTKLATRTFIKNTVQVGPRYTDAVTDTIEMVFDTMVPGIPVVYLLSVGADPTETIEALCRKKKQSIATISMGEGQEQPALKAIEAAAIVGSWVLLQNCELGLELMVQLEELILHMRPQLHDDFRFFITAAPEPEFPLGLLQMSSKVTSDPPQGLRSGLLRSLTVSVDQERMERVDGPGAQLWRKLLYNLCFVHSIVQERRKFGALGFCIPYEFNTGDLSACIMFLEKHLYAGPISWQTVQYMVSEVQYGGKITDDIDRRLMNCYASAWIGPDNMADDFVYNPDTVIVQQDFVYNMPDFPELAKYKEYCEQFPEADSPEIFGLHPNADITFLVKDVTELLDTLGDTAPKSGGTGGGKSREEIVYDKATELLEKVPDDYIPDDYKLKIRALGGMKKPLNIFLYQEVERLQKVIHRVRFMLNSLQQAVRGEVVLTAELQSTIISMYDARVPHVWTFTPGGDEFSWISPTLGLWFTSLLARDAQERAWLNDGRPNCFWMSGFKNPAGFLTAMKQEVTRMHKAEGWALDDVIYQTMFQDMRDGDSVRSKPKEGVFVTGLFCDGARWDRGEGSLVESEPKQMFSALPVLLVTGGTEEMKRTMVKNGVYGTHGGAYESPCYKYQKRTGQFYICMLDLATKFNEPRHWILRGVAVLCSTD